MALLDVAIRNYGVNRGSMLFPLLRDSMIAISPPQYIIVNNCFVRIHKLRRQKSSQGEAKTSFDDEQSEVEEHAVEEGQGPYIRSVAFREYIQYSGPLGLAVQVETHQTAEQLFPLFPQVNYLGKRGGFFQLDSLPKVRSQLPPQQGFLQFTESPEIGSAGVHIDQGAGGEPRVLLQLLDDWSPEMTFDHVNVYAPSLAVGKDRRQLLVQLPYRLLRSGHGFTLYQRTDLE